MQFANPAILWALSALVIPLIVHLFDFRRYRRVSFSDNFLLQQLLEKNKRQRRVRQIIIMLLRMLAIAAMVIAFARPYFSDKDAGINTSGKTMVSVYIDNSLSMEISDAKSDLLSKARQRALEIMSAYPAGTLFRLLTNDFDGTHERFVSSAEMTELISAIHISPFSRPMSMVLARMHELANRVAPEASHHYYMISDFQMVTSDIAAIKSQSAGIFFAPVAAPAVANISIDSVWFNGPVQLENSVLSLSAKISNHSQLTIGKIPVRLFVDGRQKGLSEAQLAPQASDVVQLSFSVSGQGAHQGYIEIDDSPLSFDDKLYFAFNLASSVPVYQLAGKDATPTIGRLFGSDSLFSFSSSQGGNADMEKLSQADLIILDELPQISGGLASGLRDAVTSGATLLIIPSANADVQSYNSMVTSMGLPALGLVDTANTRVSRLEPNDPLFKGVFETPPQNIPYPQVLSSYRLATGPGRTLMSLLNGNTFLASASMGKGRVFLLSVPLQPDWSSFASNALIVPVVLQMAFQAGKTPSVAYSLDYPYGIELPSDAFQGEKPPSLTSFDGKENIILGFSGGTPPMIFLNAQIVTPGCYQVSNQQHSIMSFGLNYPRTESQITCYSPTKLKELTHQQKNISLLLPDENPSVLVSEIQQDTKLWKIFIIFALLFITAELILLRIWI